MPFSVPADLPDLSSRTVVITGSSSGIGLAAARIFAVDGGAHVVMACRSLTKARPLCESIGTDAAESGKGGRTTLVRIDTSDLESVHQAASEIAVIAEGGINLLVLNAGIMFGPWRTAKTMSDEHPEVELMMATNHLGHFLLTNLLLPKITSCAGARIISVSSLGTL
jgi:NAD(P)-dependent dehydrogenase (short-subunit alcohol dehydrogenase family)